MGSTHVVQQFEWSRLLSSTQLVELLVLELHLLSGCVQVRAVQLSSPVLPALRISSEEMCGKASAIVFDRIVRQPGLSHAIKAHPRQVGPTAAHTRCLVDTCSPPGERFFFCHLSLARRRRPFRTHQVLHHLVLERIEYLVPASHPAVTNFYDVPF